MRAPRPLGERRYCPRSRKSPDPRELRSTVIGAPASARCVLRGGAACGGQRRNIRRKGGGFRGLRRPPRCFPIHAGKGGRGGRGASRTGGWREGGPCSWL